ncbi:hypothetical protein E2562_033886 [Oryza meyeriana var. granulata]|uniref:Uncharacterized protein n=1 Tax=Oryza meyeriana var. granulata TaxID=110450 RepID=A0A6G1BQ72_9ORYZ|nr:hypothetical protein E2562_033886 [Oryza meyeriana var. granulata]
MERAGAVACEAHPIAELVLQHGEVRGEGRGEVGVRARSRRRRHQGPDRHRDYGEEEGGGSHGCGHGIKIWRGGVRGIWKLAALWGPLGLPDDYLLPGRTDPFRLANPYPL